MDKRPYTAPRLRVVPPEEVRARKIEMPLPFSYICEGCGKHGSGQTFNGWWSFPAGWFVLEKDRLRHPLVCSPSCAERIDRR